MSIITYTEYHHHHQYLKSLPSPPPPPSKLHHDKLLASSIITSVFRLMFVIWRLRLRVVPEFVVYLKELVVVEFVVSVVVAGGIVIESTWMYLQSMSEAWVHLQPLEKRREERRASESEGEGERGVGIRLWGNEEMKVMEEENLCVKGRESWKGRGNKTWILDWL